MNRWVLPNGLTVLYQQSPDFPLAAASLLLPVGSLHETPAEAGLANFTAELLLQGTRRRSAAQIAQETEFVGASLGSQSSEDYSELGFVTPVDHVDRLLDIVADVLTQPSFPVQEVEKERASILASLKSRKDTIFTFAYDALNALLYADHPYGRPVDGTLETVRRFQAADLRRWHAAHWGPDRAVLSLIASLPPEGIRKRVETYFHRWQSPSKGSENHPRPQVRPRRHDQKVRLRAPFEQAYLMVGMPAPSAEFPASLTLKVLNVLLGGGMSSRLFLQLREEKGLAYEVSSFYPTHLALSQWVIYLGLPPEKLRQAAGMLDDILADLQRKGPTPQEVRNAIQMIKGAYVMDHQTRRRQAWYAGWWEFLGKGADYGQRFLQALETVTPQHLHELARKLLSQPRVTVEVVPKRSLG